MHRVVAGFVVAAALSAAATAAQAAEGLINKDGMTGPEVAAWLQAAGYKAQLDKDSVGDPMIKSSTDGIKFTIYFYDCVKGRCRSIQFSTGFDLDKGLALEKTNEWNRKNRYLKAFLDDENDPYVQYDVNLNDGRTFSGLDDDFAVWINILPEFAKFIDW